MLTVLEEVFVSLKLDLFEVVTELENRCVGPAVKARELHHEG
jgi:hypothetical protein